MRSARGFSGICVATGVIVLSLAASASAATVVYTSGDVPKSIDDSQTVTSTLTVPSGRTPAIDVDIVGLNTLSAPSSGDRTLTLAGPNGGTSGIIPGGCDTISDPGITVDDEAGAGFSCQPPSGSSMRPGGAPLSGLDGPSGGTWTMTFFDPSNITGAPAGELSTWSLRITHAPFEFTVAAKRQPLRKKVKLSALCNTKCTITSSGDVKTRQLVQAQGVNAKFKLPLKKRAFERLEDDGGKAKFTLVASNGYGDVSTQKVKIRFPG